jgi:hypothetical protein
VKALGQRVRELRLEQGLTLAELGERLGVGAPAICNLEKHGVDRISTLGADGVGAGRRSRGRVAAAEGCVMPVGPRPMTKAQIRAMERDKKIYDFRKQGNSWEEVGILMGGLKPETCEKYFRCAMRNSTGSRSTARAGNSTLDRNPESVAALLANAAVLVDDDVKYTRLREACKEAGLKPTIIAGLIKRLKSQLAPVVDAARAITVPEMTKELEKKISAIFSYMDEFALSQASLKDLAIALNVSIEKHQLLTNRPDAHHRLHVAPAAARGDAAAACRGAPARDHGRFGRHEDR